MNNQGEINKTILQMVIDNKISQNEAQKMINDAIRGNSNRSVNENIKEKGNTVLLQKPCNIQDINVVERKKKITGSNEIQILVKSFALNFGDLLCIKGLYPTMPEYPFTPGFEVAGIVVDKGENVKEFSIGDKVVALTGKDLGGHSSFVTVDERYAVKKSDKVNYEEACSLPVVFFTVYHIFEKANIKKGEKVLIQTAAGGIGLMAIQLAREIGAEVYATAGSCEKLNYLKNMGVKNLINYREQDFEKEILDMTSGYGVDVVINTLPKEAVQKGINILAPNGRYIELAMTALINGNNVSLSHLVNNQSIYSIDTRKLILSNPSEAKRYLNIMNDKIDKGVIKPTICKIFEFSSIKQAYSYLENKNNIGKIVVRANKEEIGKTVEDSGNKTNSDIAIIGVSGRFPNAKNIDEYWDNLYQGKNCIQNLPKDRKSIKSTTGLMKGGYLSDIDKFDSLFFNISGKEAEVIDPQQRLFLEESFNALEDAGYTTDRIMGKKCGVFVGCGRSDYDSLISKSEKEVGPQVFWGNENSILASRISYFLNLKGPSIAIDTACSSSLVSLHLACQSILNSECDMAIAGGVFFSATSKFYNKCYNANMLSPDGVLRAFDNGANGFVPGEAVGAIIIKKLEKAKRDGDRIYAVIKGSGINQDGKTNGITAPSGISQTALEEEVYKEYNINPETISYIETHGTGTKLGDPIEVNALIDAFDKFTDKTDFCALGSVKTNIGHAAAASGIASIIKVILQMKYKKIVPSLNYTKINENISLENTPFYVNTKLQDWNTDLLPRRAAVSSFGFSGTNCHVVIEEYNESNLIEQTKQEAYIVCLSTKKIEALKQKAKDLLEYINNNDEIELKDISYTLAEYRNHYNNRIAIICKSIQELKTYLSKLIDGISDENIITSSSKNINNAYHDEINTKNLIQLAWNYVNCDKVDFKSYCNMISGKIISLPKYPFNYKSYWIKDEDDNAIDQKKNDFEKELNINDVVVNEHIVNGEKILPAVGYLELVAEAMSESGENLPLCIKDLFITDKIKIDNKKVIVKSEQEEENVKFNIISLDTKESYSCGKVEFNCEKEEAIDINNLMTSYNEIIYSDKIYGMYEERGINYGDYFKSLKKVYVTNEGCIGEIELTEKAYDNNSFFIINPAVLDCALQTIICSKQYDKANLVTYIPYSIDCINIYKNTKDRKYYVILEERKNDTYNIKLYDSNGEICILINGLVLRKNIISECDYMFKPIWKKCSYAKENKKSNNIIVIRNKVENKFVKAFLQENSNNNIYDIVLGQYTTKSSDNRWKLNIDKIDDIKNILNEIVNDSNIDIYYFADIKEKNEVLLNMNSLKEIEKNSVLPLFDLIKFFFDNEDNYENVNLNVVTNNVFSVKNNENWNALQSSIIGLLMSASKEKFNINIELFDLDFEAYDNKDSIIRDINVLLELKNTNKGYPVAIRDGNIYERKLVSANINSAKQQNTFKNNGVYFIIGGAGGIGLELCEKLSKTIKANFVLIGRSRLNVEKTDKIHRIEENGSKVLYIRGDVSNLNDMQNAIAITKEKFGTINGVIHSALVLKDKLIKNMTKSIFLDSLNSKVDGSMVLYELLGKEKLDFMMFFSSAESFSGNAGQANYAAACTFEDSFALSINEYVDFPIIVINWGYFKEVGIVSNEYYLKKMRKQGVNPISIEEALKTVNVSLSNGYSQLVSIKGTTKFLTTIGYTKLEKEDLSIKEIYDRTSLGLENVKNLCNEEAFYNLIEYGRINLLKAFKNEGVFLNNNETYKINELISKIGVIPQYEKMFESLLKILADADYIVINDTFVTTKNVFIDNNSININYSDIAEYIELESNCFDNYFDILCGKINHMEVLFPDGSFEMVGKIYKNNKKQQYYNKLMAKFIKEYIIESIKMNPDRKINILEIGAGTGGTSEIVLEEIKDYHDNIKYIYTDISKGFINYGKNQFATKYNFMEFETLDISSQKSLENNKVVDIVLCTNVLHATKNIDNTLLNISNILNTDGIVLINEITKAHEFTMLTFGLTTGWWLFEDEEKRIKYTPLLSVDNWQKILKDIGFERSFVLDVDNKNTNTIVQNVIIAQKAEIKKEIQNKSTKLNSTNKFNTIQYVKNVFAKVLDFEVEELDEKETFENFGVDSLIIVQLKKEFEKKLGKFSSTALFEYNTIEKLSDYIANNFTDETNNYNCDVVEEQSNEKKYVQKDDNITVNDFLISMFAETLQISKDEFDINETYEVYGVDSLIVMELTKKLKKYFKGISATVLFENNTINKLSNFLIQEYDDKIEEIVGGNNDLNQQNSVEKNVIKEDKTNDNRYDYIDELSEEEIDKMLSKLI